MFVQANHRGDIRPQSCSSTSHFNHVNVPNPSSAAISIQHLILDLLLWCWVNHSIHCTTCATYDYKTADILMIEQQEAFHRPFLLDCMVSNMVFTLGFCPSTWWPFFPLEYQNTPTFSWSSHYIIDSQEITVWTYCLTTYLNISSVLFSSSAFPRAVAPVEVKSHLRRL